MSTQEMLLIYEMKGDIVRLNEEIRKLKKSIQRCVELQMKMQHFAKPEDFPVLKSSGNETSWRNRFDVYKLTSRGSCCICYPMEVDSLLNRYVGCCSNTSSLLYCFIVNLSDLTMSEVSSPFIFEGVGTCAAASIVQKPVPVE